MARKFRNVEYGMTKLTTSADQRDLRTVNRGIMWMELRIARYTQKPPFRRFRNTLCNVVIGNKHGNLAVIGLNFLNIALAS
ncbi:hypothetical protein CDQ91_03635 [Sphingopyxis witflariensis]|uniref:Uncharacterized protein n=1 Tax=Sphingopyxis witflariensis TaxID=173675 RepID=A0A246K6Q3_9SPHN|nr:hypothetical protein CDQ91_03635 [Sphingopyxis witflariensis]